MKRWMLYALSIITLLTLRPRDTKDVSGLIPVELLMVSRESGWFRAETDTGNYGIGRNLEAALKDLENTAPGKIFLETADYLIVTGETVHLLPELTNILRPAAEVCVGIGADPSAVEYLKAHSPGVTLNDIRAGSGTIPTLIRTRERYRFGENRKFTAQT